MNNKIYTQTLEYRIYKLFREELSDKYHIQMELRLQSGRIADIAISKGEKRLAVIEVKPISKRHQDLFDAKEQVTLLASSEDYKYAIVATDEDTLYMKDCILDKHGVFKVYSLGDICSLFDGVKDPFKADDNVYLKTVFEKLDELSKEKRNKINEFITRNAGTKIIVDDSFFLF